MDSHSEVDVSTGTSRTGTPHTPLPLRELPDELINFMLSQDVSSERPRKRQKIATGGLESQAVTELEHIIVAKSSWEVRFAGSKLSTFQTPLAKSSIRPYVHWPRWNPSSRPEYLEIVNDSRQCLFHAPLEAEIISEDLLIALLVDRESKKWAKQQGRIWTQFDVTLIQKEGYDILLLSFTIKWNTTSSPQYIHQAVGQPQGLVQMLKKYYPDPNAIEAVKWSPQDFYQSVHVPNKDDKVPASMDVTGVESTLYPFQRRAVQWLLRREGVEWSPDEGVKIVANADETTVPKSFLEVKDHAGRTCYISHVLGLVTLDVTPFKEAEQQIKGGILAEEMGLGKTVEMISLIILHQRPQQTIPQVYDNFTGQNLRPTKATLIITPPSILHQWISEIHKHAPQLRVMHYQGIKVHREADSGELLNELAASDVVISTYGVLANEIHFTPLNPEKTLRHAPKYPRTKSPLMLLSWWRCVIDEAQMIESGVSNSAVVARLIPRVNAWCVTGTPVRKDVKDLLGLLVFLRYEPYCSVKHVWSSLISSHKYEFRKLFGTLALRHSKHGVREELSLPAQKRAVIMMPFTPVEEQHYKELFEEMCADIGLDAEGAPISDAWDLDVASENMRRWLVRLRQTALHPEVGGRNRRALRQRDGPLRTIDQVLDAMIEQADVAIRTDQRVLLTSKLKKGQLLENSPRVKEALAIWEDAVVEASQMVEECREQLQQEVARVQLDENSKDNKGRDASEYDSDTAEERDDSIEESSRLSVFRNRLRNALELLHMAVFFCANAHFQIKSNEEMTVPGSPEFKALEKLETEGYERAKKLRREILREVSHSCPQLKRTFTASFY